MTSIRLLCGEPGRNAWIALAFIAVLSLAFPTAITAQTNASAGSEVAGTGRIRGVLFDSLAMKPVAHGSVVLVGTSRTAVTSENGSFAFDNVAAGTQTVTFTSALFDSLSLGTLGAAATVRANETTTISIATPSLATVWTFRCPAGNRIGSDSGIVFGELRDAATDAIVRRGAATFSWYVISGARFSQNNRGVDSDASGRYFACGLPVEIPIATNGVSDSAASGRVEYSIGSRRMQRLDMLVSRDMLVADSDTSTSSADSSAFSVARGEAAVRGVARDSAGRPLANTIVSLAVSQSTTRTDVNGRFQLNDLPAGTQTIQLRRIGSAAMSQLVQLRSGHVSEINVVLSTANTLATVNVIGKSAQRLAFEKRRAENFGWAVDSSVLNVRADLFSVFSNRPWTTAVRKGWSTRIFLRGLFSGGCEPQAFLDGLPAPMDMVTVLPPDYFRAIEVLVGKPAPDPYFTDSNCGVVLFWSKNIRW